jgi:hypothetical protein
MVLATGTPRRAVRREADDVPRLTAAEVLFRRLAPAEAFLAPRLMPLVVFFDR